MDDTTKKIAQALAVGLVKKGLIAIGTAAAAHGLTSTGFSSEFYAGAAVAIVSAGWSFWQDYGKAIVLSQLEVLKAKSLAQAAKMNAAGIAPVTTVEIAAKSPTLTTADVAKTVDKMPPAIQATVIKVALAGLLLAGLAYSGDARAQGLKLVKPTGNIAADIAAATGKAPATSSDPIANIIGALDAKLLPDLQYAKAMADASGSKVTAPCFGAWIDLINVRQKSVTGADGQPLPFPDPGIISRFEQIVELRNALQPDSAFMIACSPVASMVKKDIVGFIGIVISGGAGLATLVPGL